MDALTLGKKVKAKYPQYSKMGDEEVGSLMLKKYPQYADAKKDKKGKWMPVVGGTVGGIIGSILGPAGAAAGAAAGTGAGIAAQGAVYGDQNRTEGAYSGEKTKLGFQKLTPQGQKETGIGLASDVKDVGVAGATGYLGAKIPGLGPAGNGILPAAGRIGVKTAASTALGAGTGFLAGDFGDTSMEERVSGAKTGAAVGGVLGFGGSVFQEGVRVIQNRNDIAKDLAKTYKETKDKVSLDKKIWNKTIETARGAKEKITNNSIINQLKEEAKLKFGESGKDYNTAMKLIGAENPSKVYSVEEALNIGSGTKYSANTGPINNWFRNTKKRIIAEMLPKDVADWKAVYAMNKDLSKPMLKTLSRLVAGATLGAGGLGIYGLTKK